MGSGFGQWNEWITNRVLTGIIEFEDIDNYSIFTKH